jgi:protocatechuate 3,4-dioxygenase beta subunit
LVSMFRAILLCLTLAGIASAVRAGEPTRTIVVVGPDGQPAAGAKVWIYPSANRTDVIKEPTALVADSLGKVSVPAEENARLARYLFARDSAGRIGSSMLYPTVQVPDGNDGIKITLIDITGRAGRVTGADGKPVAGATVVPLAYYAEGRPGASIDLPEWERTRLTVRSDGDGSFKLSAPAAGYSVFYRVKATGYGESKWSAPVGVELATKLTRPGSLTIAFSGVDPALLKGRNWRLGELESPRDSASGPRPVRNDYGPFDGSGKLTFPEIVPARYELQLYLNGTVPAVLGKMDPIEVSSGKAVTIHAKFGLAAKAVGTINDKATGKGVAGIRVFVSVMEGGRPRPHQFFVETDRDGRFTVYGPAGWYAVVIQAVPDGLSLPPLTGPRGELVESAKVEIGKSHTFTAIELLKSVTLTGRIILPDGRPAIGATVMSHGDVLISGRWTKVAADKNGNFALTNLPPDDVVTPRVQLGKAVNVPQTFDLEKATEPVTIEVSEANAAGFRGRVLDPKGKPVSGVRVTLTHHVQLVGRNSQYGIRPVLTTTTTDSEGRYSFTGLWPRDPYSAKVSGDGYTEAETNYLVGAAGETQEFPVLKIARASLSISGTVTGTDGKPLAGAEVFGVDGHTRFATTSAADGSFTLTGFNEGAGFVFARKAGYRLASVPITAGSASPRVVVNVAPTSDPPPALPAVSTQHRAALAKLTRHAVTQVWETRVEFGYGGNALGNMARIDLDTAKKWCDEEKKRTDGKTDLTRTLDRAIRVKTLLGLAKDDIDEALAVIGPLSADDGFTAAYQVGQQMLAIDKAKATRLAEEAVVKARQRDIPAKVWSLAQAGDLAARAGNTAGGKKVLLEAAALAEKLSGDDRGQNAYAVGMVADRLVPHDPAKAEALLASIRDASEYNRALSAAAGRLAATDLARAKQLLERFKPDNSFAPHEARLRVAFAIAAKQPDDAIALVNGVSEKHYRCLGYLRLAVLFAPTDKARAIKAINAVYELLEADPEAFRSWSNSAGRAGLAAVAAVRAKETGYPEVAGLVTRALAMRPVGRDDWSPENHESNIVNIAAVLALVDPATARHVLATVAPADQYVERALSQRRDWLFALALADPERAMTLIDRLIQRAKTQPDAKNALSATGIVELCSILCADDVLTALAVYGNLPREIRDED